MKRRSFFNTLFSANLGILLAGNPFTGIFKESKKDIFQKGTVSVDDNTVSFYLDKISSPMKIIHISDTHLWMDDDRGKTFLHYSRRMAGAYNTTKHFRTGADTDPVRSFEQVLELAVEKDADLIAMTGDIFSFPSEAAIEWVHEKVSNSGVPYLYIAGNHDWHYEGMEGSRKELRDIWTNKRLIPLYQGNDPMMAFYNINGLNILAIDNSTYEILPEQLEFFRENSKGDGPFILMMHIPLYAPGRPIGYGCGNPFWGAESDRLYELESRERWPEEGHTKVTMDFYDEVFSSDNLLGIFAGHVHRQSIDIVRGKPQFVAEANATGAYLEINFLPLNMANT
ncbi:MAG: metallophosphoesterase [Bacteroidales bacterium]|nr:metallophosphoesterase [Bacteroidales bacterium]